MRYCDFLRFQEDHFGDAKNNSDTIDQNLHVSPKNYQNLPKTFFCTAGDIRPLAPSISKNVVSCCNANCASSDPFDKDCENIT